MYYSKMFNILTNFSVSIAPQNNLLTTLATKQIDNSSKLLAEKITDGLFNTVSKVCKQSFHQKLYQVCQFISLQFLFDDDISISKFCEEKQISEQELVAIQRRTLSEVGFDVYQFAI